jgi:serine-type D-Ala-D-Ala carboxypeptidase/endopeptidase (penicillin-binding protein 4)
VDALRALDVDELPEPLDRSGADTLFVHVSPPLGYLLEEVGQHSNNFYADQIFRSFGWAGTAEGAAARVQAFVREAGAKAELVSLADGSGLSRLDYVTPESLARTLIYMRTHPERAAFQNQLAYPGGGTTLGYRLSDLDVRAKTGSLEYARALSGYVVSKSGRTLAFSIMANNFAGSPLRVLATIDDLVRAAAEGL